MIRRNYDAACPHFEVLGTLRPRDPSAPLMAGLCAAMKLDFATAITQTERAHQILPSPRTQINLALITFMSGKAQAAADQADTLRASAPLLMQAGFVAGKAHLALGQFEQARAVYAAMVAGGGDAAVEGLSPVSPISRAAPGVIAEARTQLQQRARGGGPTHQLVRGDDGRGGTGGVGPLGGKAAGLRDGNGEAGEVPPEVYLAYRVGRARARGGMPTGRRRRHEGH